MSAFGPKRTWTAARHMSAFGWKADMTLCESPLSRSLLGVKRTWLIAPHESAFDPKRTSELLPITPFKTSELAGTMLDPDCRGGGNETARIHHVPWSDDRGVNRSLSANRQGVADRIPRPLLGVAGGPCRQCLSQAAN